MHQIDENDRVVPLDVPEPDAADPLPIVLAKDGAVILSFMSLVARKDMSVLISFPVCLAHRFGPACADHPLAERGVTTHGAFEVKDSSWARREFGGKGKHFVFTFRDSTFECVAEDYGCEILDEQDDVVKLMAKRLYK